MISTAAQMRSFAALPGHLIGLSNPPGHGTPFTARRTFKLGAPVVSARVYSTSLGVHQVFLNGAAVDDGILKPGWTAYGQRVIGEQTDVLALLRETTNVIVLEVAGGWFTEDFGHLGNKGHWYGVQPSAAVRLELTYADGSEEHIHTDSVWRTSSDGPILSASIYDGEAYDARRLSPSIHTAGFDDSDWLEAQLRPIAVACTPRTSPPVRVTQRVAPVDINQTGENRYIVDFGQNLVGRLRIRVSGSAGQEIILRHAEVLEHGELATAPLRAARATDRYVLAGEPVESWTPQYTFHGFRYAEISGWPQDTLPVTAITAEVIGTDLERTGWFESSSALLNRLHENVVWSARGNFLSIPSDCPQRDERLGWTGDIQVFTPTAAILFDIRRFLENWLVDLRLEQQDRAGLVPVLVPDPLRDISTPAAGWGDAATIVPWALYQHYGDPAILRVSFQSMRDWVALVRTRMPEGLWEGDFQFGDWLDPAAPSDNPGFALTSHDLVATAYAYRSASILVDTARVLGQTGTANEVEKWCEQIRSAFQNRYVTAGGLLVSDNVAAYTLALAFGLARDDEPLAHQWTERLARLVRKAGYRISTGFLATPLLCDVLADGGHGDAALKVLLQTKHPSWLSPVLKGATTVWERWDSLLEDGSVNPGQMTSFNHFALGAVVDFIHRRVAGLAPAAPGYRKIIFAPLAPTTLTHASSTIDTPQGRASIAWTLDEDTMTIVLDVPETADAEFVDPFTGARRPLKPGKHHIHICRPKRTESASDLQGLDTALSEIIDDEEAYQAVLEVLNRLAPSAAHEFETSASWIPERTLDSVLVFLPASVRNEIGTALDHISLGRRTGAAPVTLPRRSP